MLHALGPAPLSAGVGPDCMNISTLTVAFVLLMPCVLFSQATTNAPADRTPPGWQVEQIARDALGAPWTDGGRWTNATGHILVWKIEEDTRPLYSESAVLWLQIQTTAGKKWKLAHVFRHPKYPFGKTWCLNKIMDTPQHDTSAVYDRPPRADVLEAFLRETWWSFKPDRGFRLIDGAVCVQNWQASTGSPAPQGLVNEPGRWRSKTNNEAQQDGPANGNQPFSSETNRTSSAAGSRR
jgi:hypothetical protein